MTDLEMTKLCAEAMGIALTTDHHDKCWFHWPAHSPMISPYDPLHDDGQAMALVKRFDITHHDDGGHVAWLFRPYGAAGGLNRYSAKSTDLNRAIVECVAKMQGQVKPQYEPVRVRDGWVETDWCAPKIETP